MPTHADHAVKSYNFSKFLKQVKNTQRVKIWKSRFENLQMGSKATIRNFYFCCTSQKNADAFGAWVSDHVIIFCQAYTRILFHSRFKRFSPSLSVEH
jgi:hypothetical protein